MTLVKLKKHRLPWYDTMFNDLMGTDRLLTNDFFMENKWIPEMNIKENEDNFEIELAVPGFDKKDFNISIENGILYLSAERKDKINEEEEDKYTRREFHYHSFTRSMTLPENVDEKDHIVANYKNGILKITLEKLPEGHLTHKKIIKIS
jgi:HSP20 family protein